MTTTRLSGLSVIESLQHGNRAILPNDNDAEQLICVMPGRKDPDLQVGAQTGVQLLPAFDGHMSSVFSVAFLPDGRHIVSGSDDNTIRVWDAQTGVQSHPALEGHTGDVTSHLIPHSQRLYPGQDHWIYAMHIIRQTTIVTCFHFLLAILPIPPMLSKIQLDFGNSLSHGPFSLMKRAGLWVPKAAFCTGFLSIS
ncbi:uncharacterized protein FIBRA_08932 [Fibroporia radiculosa]|uniref:Uncharacterized protein n=1 Tax=Fibroporia radiculosa TaxID=599839 RepID=J4H5F5_9APHY|nr:uncharacterized protein FIBRA_08932 [Fibroporia radiculosa]CCM06649.1 predicted protein [Fibroporia radiculosa]